MFIPELHVHQKFCWLLDSSVIASSSAKHRYMTSFTKEKTVVPCISLAKSLHRAFNPESVHSLELLHYVLLSFFATVRKFCPACQSFGSLNFALTNPDCRDSHQSYTIHIGKMKMKYLHLPFLFIET